MKVPYAYDCFGQSTSSLIIDWVVPLAIIFAIPIMVGIEVFIEHGLIKHFYKRPHSDQILIIFGLAIVIQEIIKYFSAQTKFLHQLQTHLLPRLAQRRKQQSTTLSGGEQQMLAVSPAWIRKTKLLLLD